MMHCHFVSPSYVAASVTFVHHNLGRTWQRFEATHIAHRYTYRFIHMACKSLTGSYEYRQSCQTNRFREVDLSSEERSPSVWCLSGLSRYFHSRTCPPINQRRELLDLHRFTIFDSEGLKDTAGCSELFILPGHDQKWEGSLYKIDVILVEFRRPRPPRHPKTERW